MNSKFQEIVNNIGFDSNKRLDKNYIKELEQSYNKTIKHYFNTPDEIGKVVYGVAKYESLKSEIDCIEKSKGEMEFVGFYVVEDACDIIEFYLKDNNLYTFLYHYYFKNKETTKTLNAILIEAESDVLKC